MTSQQAITPSQFIALINQRLGLDTQRRIGLSLHELFEQLQTEFNMSDIHHALTSQPDHSPIWQRIIGELTLGETYFFRNQAQFQLLETQIFPELIEKNRHTHSLMIWSAGCATGEEAYSLAMTLMQLLPDFADWKITIIGTDIHHNAIQAAKRGIYRAWSFRHDLPEALSRYFEPVENGFQIRPEVQRTVTFRQGNLINPPPENWADLVLCRNVMLYFTPDARQKAEQSLYKALRPDGWLLLGHAEAIQTERQQWMTHLFPGVIAYQKSVQQATKEDLPTYQNHPSPKRQSVTAALQPMKPDDVEVRFNRAVESYHRKAYASAEKQLGELLTEYPTYIRARVLLAAVFASRQAYPEANAQLDTALYLDPLWADAHYMRAILLLDEKRTDDGEKALKAALYSTPYHPLSAFLLGNQHAQRGEVKRATNLWQQAIQHLQQQTSDVPFSDLTHHTANSFAELIQQSLRKYQG